MLTSKLITEIIENHSQIYVCAKGCNFIYFYLFVRVQHTHPAYRRLIKTDKTERFTRHWMRRNSRVADTFCNCVEGSTTGLQTHCWH